MKAVNNFNIVVPILDFSDKDLFYHIVLVKRRKDKGNEDMEVNSRIIKHYTITSQAQLEDSYDEMIDIAEVTNSRVGIFLNRRSWKQVAGACVINGTQQIVDENYKSVKRSYFKAVGEGKAERRFFILDFDGENAFDNLEIVWRKLGEPEYWKLITNSEKGDGPEFTISVPSRTGWHLIVPPARYMSTDFLVGVDFDVQKDAYTNLYVPATSDKHQRFSLRT